MRLQIVVGIYDRFENLKRWVHTWKQCGRTNTRLTIVHNVDVLGCANAFKSLCQMNGIGYVQRPNIGFETGIIQDLFLKRLRHVGPRWDALLFCTDDTIPMRRDFVNHFRNALTSDVGVACMEISGTWTPHIRTTGFCVKLDVARAIKWVHAPIATKEHCYFFEHQGFEDTFMSQVLKMDKRVIQLSSIKNSVLWDTDHHADHNRMDEWRKAFPGFQE